MGEEDRNGNDRKIRTDNFFLEKSTYIELTMNKILFHSLMIMNYEIAF